MAAKLAALTDEVIEVLHAAPAETWSDYSIGTSPSDFLRAKPVIDPETFFESQKAGLFVVPVTMTYNRQASQGRQQIVSLNRSPVIALCLSYRFPTPDTTGLDVSPWELVKKMLNLREEIDTYLLKYPWDWNISGVTAEPAQEIPLKARWFLSVTEIEFEGMSC